MKREFITCESEQAWLDLRTKDLTSTECAALFDCSPYMTEYELWHRKTGQLVVEFDLNDRVKWGSRLESAIAYGIAEDLGLIVEPFKVYGRIDDLKMGSSFDFKIIGIDPAWAGEDETYRDLYREYGQGIMEVKNVDGLQFRRGWITGEDKEAPPHIELQVQHQMEVADMPYAVMAPLVGGNTPQPFYRLRDNAIGEAIKEKVTAFWAMIDKGTAPAPNYAKDSDVICKLYQENDGTRVDLSDDERLYTLCLAYKKFGDEKKVAEVAQKAAKAEILTIIKAAKEAVTLGHKISASTTAPSSFSVTKEPSERLYVTVKEVNLTLAPVGGSSYDVEREGFRNVRISALK